MPSPISTCSSSVVVVLSSRILRSTFSTFVVLAMFTFVFAATFFSRHMIFSLGVH